jgi:hypothetical protein
MGNKNEVEHENEKMNVTGKAYPAKDPNTKLNPIKK